MDAAAEAAAGGTALRAGYGIRGRRHAFSAEPWAAEDGALDSARAWWATDSDEATEAEARFWEP